MPSSRPASPLAPTRAVREGIQLRHSRRCRLRDGEPCSCTPSYQAQVWSPVDRKPIRKTLPTLAAAQAWRQESQVALRRGTMRAPTPTTLREAAEDWLSAAEQGIVRTRSGDPFKPSALRSYRESLNTKALPLLGSQKLSAISRNQIQDLADSLLAQGLSPSSVRNAVLPLRAIYRRALQRNEIAINPTLNLALPAVRGHRDRVAAPAQAAALITALPAQDQALWATAFYAGLRRGELQALTWNDIDLQHNVINVNHSWDRRAGLIEPKSRAGKRRVPLIPTLRRHLAAHRLQTAPPTTNSHVFANQTGRPFHPDTILQRAHKHWHTHQLQPFTFHECRHTYAAFMIAAGINAKALSTYMGHSTITVTLDRYGHLLPGNEHQAAKLLETLLANGQH